MQFFSVNRVLRSVRTLLFPCFHHGTYLPLQLEFTARRTLKGNVMGLPKKLCITGGAMFTFGVVVLSIATPLLLKSQIRTASKLTIGSNMRELWTTIPFPLNFKIYIFNVTNPEGVTKGEKPIVKEVGPFFYDEWKEKVDLEDSDEDDTVEYSQRTTWIYNPKKSKCLTGNEMLTVPHLFMLGAIMATMRDKPGMIGLTGKAMDSIFKKPSSIFVTVKAHDYLFGGLPIDCTVKDFAGSAVCSYLKGSPDLQEDGEDRYKFSLFGAKNGTIDNNRIRVKRGSKDVSVVGEVVEYKGKPHETVWPEGSKCNVFNGTDGTIFHPFFYENERIVAFGAPICRSMFSEWDGTRGTVGGIPTNHYVTDFGDMSTDPDLKCFCEAKDKCLKKGLYDLFKCIGIPMVMSLPHWYKVDKSYFDQVEGLSPSKKKHQIDADFEPITGNPLSGRSRVQFNMFVYPIDKVKTMKTFATALMPLFWVEESVTVPEEYLKPLRMLFKVYKTVAIMKWMMVLGGAGLGGAAARLHFKKLQRDEMNMEVIKVLPQAESQNWQSQSMAGIGRFGGTEKTWPLNVRVLQAAPVMPMIDRA